MGYHAEIFSRWRESRARYCPYRDAIILVKTEFRKAGSVGTVLRDIQQIRGVFDCHFFRSD
jgi:hypothetical protein